MQRAFVTIDVFTDRRFGGNPLAVVLDAEGLTTAQMQAIANEFNLSETTFVLPPKDPAHSAEVRIFTPKFEMPFAGHPNVGTGFVVARRRCSHEPLVFEEKAGLVPIELLSEGGEVVGARLTAPRALSVGDKVDPAIVAAACALGAGGHRDAAPYALRRGMRRGFHLRRGQKPRRLGAGAAAGRRFCAAFSGRRRDRHPFVPPRRLG